MIRIEFYSGVNGLCGFEATGHASCGEAGNDILCAYVSSACQMTANTVTDVLMLDADAQAENGYLKLMILENATSAQDILNGLKLHMTELSKDYPKNIQVIYRRCNNA